MANTRPKRYFGIVSDLSGSIGAGLIANNVQKKHTTEVAESRDERGRKLDIAPYDENKEMTIDGLFVGDGVDVGSVVNIDGQDYLVSQSNATESNTAFKTASITVQGGNEDTVVWPLSSVYDGSINN